MHPLTPIRRAALVSALLLAAHARPTHAEKPPSPDPADTPVTDSAPDEPFPVADPDPAEAAALARREILIEGVQRGDLPGVRARFAVQAPAERIWAALIDYAHFTQIFAGIDRLQVLEQDASGATVEFWIDAVITHYHYVLRREYDDAPYRLHWTRVSGDLDRVEGQWQIRELDASPGCLVTYEVYVAAGGLVPNSLIRWVALRKTREMAEHLRAWIEAPHEPR